MNNSFLAKVVTQVLEDHKSDLRNVTIISPNRRSIIFLKKYFREKVNATIWFPRVITINEFIKENTPLNVIDNIDSLLQFYKVYSAIHPDESHSLDEFFTWAPQLIADFNDVDKYLIDPKQIFSDLRSIKEIENWSFNEEELTELQQKFVTFWNHLYTYYKNFNEELAKSNQLYEGQAYRYVSDNIFSCLNKHEEKQVYFIGFNALTGAEEKIFEYFTSSGKGTVLFDVDEFYFNNKMHEAGYFFRKYQKKGRLVINNLEENFKEKPKEINFVSASNSIDQAVYVANLISDFSKDEMENTAVILSDETLLKPFLFSLPDNVESTNISMGYGLNNSEFFTFFNSIINLQINYQKFNTKNIYFKEFLVLLNNKFSSFFFNHSKKLVYQIKSKNLSFVNANFLEVYFIDDKVQKLFSPWNNIIEEGIECLLFFVEIIKASFNKLSIIEKEELFSFNKLIYKLKQYKEALSQIKEVKTFKKLFIQLASQQQIAFLGDPLSGLQIMGILESRTLDFENIIMTSMNEGFMPQQSKNMSFIPYDLRTYFGLPVKKEKEAIYSHHFYRLLQRASNIYLIYSSQVDDFGANEHSRYLIQIKKELMGYNPKNQLEEKIIQVPIKNSQIAQNEVKNHEELIPLFETLFEKGLSPTSISTYLNCPLDFYYKYIALLKEVEQVEESMESNVLGSIIHDALEEIYTPFLGSFVDSITLKNTLKTIPEILNKYYEHYTGKIEIKGKDFILYNLAVESVGNLIKQDVKLSEKNQLKIVALESNLETAVTLQNHKVKLRGKVDRIDELNGITRIIDYKTGSVKPEELNLKSIEEVFKNKKTKALQLLIYAMFYADNFNKVEVHCGIQSLRKTNKVDHGIFLLKYNGMPEISQELIDEFKEHLLELFENMLTEDFIHNEKSMYCGFC